MELTATPLCQLQLKPLLVYLSTPLSALMLLHEPEAVLFVEMARGMQAFDSPNEGAIAEAHQHLLNQIGHGIGEHLHAAAEYVLGRAPFTRR